ncbi:MAG TPA: hypothetical protein P5217_04680 [Methanoregulaceae archaeon]|nr:hypothetical protein [Methanoregulaceae archaeon]HPD76036.1 hypothetical protein [Methanoregulaceae archaeon]HRY75558.1 hypothetical protein [Methanoregulaceae archaeon]
MKKLIVILMILIVGILACGCTSQSTTPATTVPTTAAPTPVPTTEVPTAVPTMEVTTEIPTIVVTTVVTTATPTPTPLPDVTVKVTGAHGFSPSTVTIPAGTKVIFSTNSIDSTFHLGIVKSIGGNDIVQSDLITYKKPWSYTFKTAGKFYVADTDARNEYGTIIVK